MKKIGLGFLALFFVACLLVEGADARRHGHHRGRDSRIYFGFPIIVGPQWYPYRHYPEPPIIVEQPTVYVQPPPREEINYWYYCEDPKGYYPYINRCPGGWMKVLPNTDPGEEYPN